MINEDRLFIYDSPFTVYHLPLNFSVAVEDRRIHFKEARSAINRSALGRIERNSCCLAATCAVDGDLDALTNAGCLSCSYRCEALVLSLFTFFATLGWVLEFFITEECLLSNCPREVNSTVDAKDRFVFKF